MPDTAEHSLLILIIVKDQEFIPSCLELQRLDQELTMPVFKTQRRTLELGNKNFKIKRQVLEWTMWVPESQRLIMERRMQTLERMLHGLEMNQFV